MKSTCGIDGIRVPQSDTLAVGVFLATILAKTGPERVLREAQQLPERVSSVELLFVIDVLVHTRDVLIGIPATASRCRKIISQTAVRWKRNQA